MGPEHEHLDAPVLELARELPITLREDMTVGEALDSIRRRVIGDRIIYFYLVDADERLAGVLPTRRLLTAPVGTRLADLMISRVRTLPDTATVLEACEAFLSHKLLAFPIVDAERRLRGVVDVSILSEEALDVAERHQTDALFESIGFQIGQVRDASPLRAMRFRFPWLLATIGSGTLCALLASAFERTLAETLALAFFLTLVLGLGESVGMQSMTVTIQALRSKAPDLRWYLRSLRREGATALLLGSACGGLVGLIVWGWLDAGRAGLTIATSILLALCMACFLGLSVPALLHALRLDPKISAGPVTLALTDVCTLVFYFGLAAWLL